MNVIGCHPVIEHQKTERFFASKNGAGTDAGRTSDPDEASIAIVLKTSSTERSGWNRFRHEALNIEPL